MYRCKQVKRWKGLLFSKHQQYYDSLANLEHMKNIVLHCSKARWKTWTHSVAAIIISIIMLGGGRGEDIFDGVGGGEDEYAREL